MYAQVEKPKKNKSRAAANFVGQKKRNEKQGFRFVDNRPELKFKKVLQLEMPNSKNAEVELQEDNRNSIVQRVHLGNTNTQETNDEKLIRKMVMGRSPSYVYELQKAIAMENGNNAAIWIKVISEVFNEEQQWEVVDAAQLDKTVNISGNITLDDKIILWAGPYPAGKETFFKNDYKILSDTPEQRISQNDADGKLLTTLIKGLKTKVGSISYGKHLEINIHDSSGPCDGCKERIEKFQKDFIQYIQESHVLIEPLVLSMNIYYKAPVIDKKRGNVPTTYGYKGDQKTDLKTIKPLVHKSVQVIRPPQEGAKGGVY